MDERSELVEALREWVHLFMHSSSRMMQGFFQFAREKGISMPQIGALFHLSRAGRVGVSEIGERLGVTSAAASQMLDKLVQSGLVIRSEDPHDRRAKQIELTERGQEMIRQSMDVRQRWLVDVANSLDQDEVKAALSGLKILIEHTGRLRGNADSLRHEMMRRERRVRMEDRYL